MPVPAASIRRIELLEAKLEKRATVAGRKLLDAWLATMTNDERRAAEAHAREWKAAGRRVPTPPDLAALGERIENDPALSAMRRRAAWLRLGRDWGRVWRALN